MRLAWVESCLPAPTLAERLELARRHGLALELAHRTPGERLEAELAACRDLDVVSLQAHGMHDLHPLHPDPNRRARAPGYLREVVRAAAEHDIPRVVTVCGFGHEVADRPFERCLDFFAELAPVACEAGVRLMLEPLSPLKCAVMTELSELSRLMTTLDRADVFTTLLDTGHLLDGGHDPVEIAASWPHPVEEVQLRGRRSAPPPEDVGLSRLVARLREPLRVVSVEHRQPIAPHSFERLLAHLKREVSAGP